jgi:hypothetical protein
MFWFGASDVPQSRNELVENRICTFSANLFNGCLNFADFDDALVDFIICMCNELSWIVSLARMDVGLGGMGLQS